MTTIADLPHFNRLHDDVVVYKPCPADVVNRYRGVLPEILVDTWQQAGFQRFSHGFLWTVNPDEFRDIVSDFVHDYQAPDSHVVLRTAFGDLIFAYKDDLFHMSAVTLKHAKLSGTFDQVLEMDLGQEDFVDSIFFFKEFQSAKRRLGDLREDEVYGFVPAVPIGGTFDSANLEKLNLRAHLHFLASL